jgi:hypothetical protein
MPMPVVVNEIILGAVPEQACQRFRQATMESGWLRGQLNRARRVPLAQ